jgi:hypothetical protein
MLPALLPTWLALLPSLLPILLRTLLAQLPTWPALALRRLLRLQEVSIMIGQGSYVHACMQDELLLLTGAAGTAADYFVLHAA